jgi:hypothetical protein
MKNSILFLLWVVVLGCSHASKAPDVSAIPVTLQIERFDQDFFAADTLHPQKALASLQARYPDFMPVFMKNILGLREEAADSGFVLFRRLNQFIADSVNNVFAHTHDLEKEFKRAFQYVKYYFPDYPVPRIITIIGPVDLLAETATGELTPDFLGKDFLGISLQFYLGKDFSLYKDEFFVSNVAPAFRSRRFDKKYLVADAIKLIVDDLFPDQSKGKGLIEQMIEKGKQWWLLDHFLPGTPDSIKTGFTTAQLNWCRKNEGLIWNSILTNEKNMYTTDPASIQNYIGEAPFTPTMPTASPGNIGQWVGWQIVKKFAEKNASLTLSDVMKTDPGKIFEQAKYKPK